MKTGLGKKEDAHTHIESSVVLLALSCYGFTLQIERIG